MLVNCDIITYRLSNETVFATGYDIFITSYKVFNQIIHLLTFFWEVCSKTTV